MGGEWLSTLLVALLAVQSGAPGSGTAPGGLAPEVRYAAGNILAVRARLRSWTATVTYVKEEPLEWFRFYERKRADQVTGRPRITRTVEKATWRCEEPRLAVSTESDAERVPGRDVLTGTKLVIDIKTATYLQTYIRAARSPGESDETRQDASIAAAGSELGRNLREAFSYNDPRRIAHYSGSVPLEKVLTNPASSTTFVGYSVYDGARCMKFAYRVGKEGTAVVGVDMEHGFINRTMEQYATVRGKRVLTSRTLTTKVAQDGSVWMPAAVERETFAPRMFLPEYRAEKDPTKTVRILREQVTIADFKANPTLPAGTFTLDLPPGTDISDHTKEEKQPTVAAP